MIPELRKHHWSLGCPCDKAAASATFRIDCYPSLNTGGNRWLHQKTRLARATLSRPVVRATKSIAWMRSKRGESGTPTSLPFSLRVLLENLLRQEDGRFVHAGDIEALADWQPVAETARRNCLHARARAAAGFHRRARRRRSGGDARRHRQHGRRSEEDQSPAARRTGDRPFRAGGQVRHRHGLRVQRRTRIPAQRRALRIPALGTERAFRISRSFRRIPASATR